MSVLHELIETEKDIQKLRKLLKEGVSPNIQAVAGYTPLHIAVLESERNPQDIEFILQATRELINFGANVDQGNVLKRTPLHLAVSCRNYKMVELLLQSNAQINEKDIKRSAALHYATSKCAFYRCNVYNTDLGVVKLLLKYNPEVDIRNRLEQTPLMLAVRNNNFQIVLELLKKNASVNLQDSKGKSVIHYALDRQDVNENIILELVRHGCSFNTSTDLMTFYIRKLVNASQAEVEKAKYVFKLFVFDRSYFNCHQLNNIIEIYNDENNEMCQFLKFCNEEIEQMRLDELAPNYSVFNIALRSVFCRVFKNHIPSDIVEKMLNKLIKGQYPLYRDHILSGICRPYMNKKFADMCCYIEKIGRKCLKFDELYFLSFYLSEFDMLNAMIAFSGY